MDSGNIQSYHPHKQYIEFSKKHPLEHTSFEQWGGVDRKGWRVVHYKNGVKGEEDTSTLWWTG